MPPVFVRKLSYYLRVMAYRLCTNGSSRTAETCLTLCCVLCCDVLCAIDGVPQALIIEEREQQQAAVQRCVSADISVAACQPPVMHASAKGSTSNNSRSRCLRAVQHRGPCWLASLDNMLGLGSAGANTLTAPVLVQQQPQGVCCWSLLLLVPVAAGCGCLLVMPTRWFATTCCSTALVVHWQRLTQQQAWRALRNPCGERRGPRTQRQTCMQQWCWRAGLWHSTTNSTGDPPGAAVAPRCVRPNDVQAQQQGVAVVGIDLWCMC